MERRERILIYVTDRATTSALIRRGRRVADYLRGDCFAVHVTRHAKGAEQACPTRSRSISISRGASTSRRAP